jgi:hypothetical protein
MMNVHDAVCHLLSGKLGVVEAAARDKGLFKTMLKIRYSDGRLFFVAPEYLTADVSRSAEIIRAGKKRSPSLANDDE